MTAGPVGRRRRGAAATVRGWSGRFEVPAATAMAGRDEGTAESEAELVARARQDPASFGPLYARYVRPIYRYCYQRLGSKAAAEDATSQTFMQALAALPRWREGSFRAWLFTIAHHAVTDIQRRRPALALSEASDAIDAAPSPEEYALAAEARRTVAGLLDALPAEQRRVVELRLAGLTGPEIARVLGRRPEAVKSMQFRAYARMRRLLGIEPDREHGKDGGDAA